MKTIVALNCACVDVFEQLNEIHPGGEALNFCGNICHHRDFNVYLMGAIGQDRYGQAILDSIKNYPIHLDYLRIDAKGETANHQILLTEDGDRYFPQNAWHGGVYETFGLSEQDSEFLSKADVVHTTIGAPVFNQVLELRKNADFLLAVDFNEYRDFDKWESFVPFIDVFFISGCDEILPRLQNWSGRYSGVFVSTLAAQGSIAFQHEHVFRTAAVPVREIIDTTGAGDSYQAGFMASYCMEKNIKKAMEEGSKQASYKVNNSPASKKITT